MCIAGAKELDSGFSTLAAAALVPLRMQECEPSSGQVWTCLAKSGDLSQAAFQAHFWYRACVACLN